MAPFMSSTIHGVVNSNADKTLWPINNFETLLSKWIPAYTVKDGFCVCYWSDQSSEAKGWIVIDSPVPTLSGGGLFLHERTTFTEVRYVARSMSLKLAVSSQPHIVGAKGGIYFPPQHPEASHVLERFIRDHASVIAQYWGTGADINTHHAIIDKHVMTYCPKGTVNALDALRNLLGCVGSSPSDVASLLKEPVNGTRWSLEQ
ncbi:glu leu phe val dehydrogenase family [Fusarium sp. NRRL 52700]|nr:glu leu phe val dehydrogenase family [Fusarium sp. NRRL 52700]